MNQFLIVVDMQADFIDGAIGSPEAVAILPAVAQKIRSFPGKIIFTQDTHDPGYLSTQEGKNLPVEHCIKGTAGWQIHPELLKAAEGKDVRTFEKPTFGSTQLVEWLTAENASQPIDGIELVGLCTDICVVSNALLLKAYLPEVPISVDSACCAGTTPDNHKSALVTMASCQIRVS